MSEMHPLIKLAIEEDLRERGDATSNSLIDPAVQGEAIMVPRSPGFMAGGEIAAAVFTAFNPELEPEILLADGERFDTNTELMRIRGSIRSLLTAERTALNFIQRFVGIATYTSKYVEAVKGTKAKVLDTRKTLPAYRELDKHAVACGGGTNHRMGLYDRVMIKDNHVAFWTEGNNLPDAVRECRKKNPDLVIESEADTVEQVRELVKAEPDWILLDNMTLEQLRTCVDICAGKCLTEASGGVTLDTIGEIAKTGVDAISVGALTHSVKAHDISLDLIAVD